MREWSPNKNTDVSFDPVLNETTEITTDLRTGERVEMVWREATPVDPGRKLLYKFTTDPYGHETKEYHSEHVLNPYTAKWISGKVDVTVDGKKKETITLIPHSISIFNGEFSYRREHIISVLIIFQFLFSCWEKFHSQQQMKCWRMSYRHYSPDGQLKSLANPIKLHLVCAPK